MRNLKFIVSLLFVLACFVNCKDDDKIDDKPAVTFKVNISQLDFDATSGSKEFVVETNSKDFSVSRDFNWYKAEVSGLKVTVSVEANVDTTSRVGNLYLYIGEDIVSTIVVKQAGTKPNDKFEYKDATYTLNDNVEFFSEDQISKIASVDLSKQTFYLSNMLADNMIPQVGHIYILNTPTADFPNGLIAHIQEVTETAEGYAIRYSHDGLNAAFKDLDICQKIDLDTYVSRIEDANGNEIPYARNKSAGKENINITLPQVALPLPLGAEFTPNVNMDLTLKTQILMDNYSISTLNFVVDADMTLGADISIGVEESETIYVKVMKIYFAAIPVGPLLVTPSIDVYAIFEAGGKISLETNISYKQFLSYGFHYDEQNGMSLTSTPDEKDNKGWQPATIGPKVEGSVAFGLSIGPAIGIYGDVVSVGMTCSGKLKTSLIFSQKCSIYEGRVLDLENFDYSKLDGNNATPALALRDMKLNFDFVTYLSGHFSGIGFPLSKDLPEVTFPINSYNIIPEISKNIDSEQNGENVTLRTWVKNKHLFSGTIKAVFVPDNGDEPIFSDFDYNEGIRSQLNNELIDSALISTSITLPHGVMYSYYIVFDYNGNDIILSKNYDYFYSVDADAVSAISAILDDILASQDGEWKDCNWTDPKVKLSELTNVTINLKEKYFEVTIPEKWKMTNSLHIRNRTSKTKDIEKWSLNLVSGDREFSSVKIEDEKTYHLYVGDHIDKFTYNSKLEYYIPDDVKELDLSGTPIQTFVISENRQYNPDVVIFNNCPNLGSIEVNRKKTTNKTMPKITMSDCSKFSSLTLNSVTPLSADLLKDVEADNYSLYIVNCSLPTITYNSGIKKLAVVDCTVESINIAGLNKLKTISLQDVSCGPVSINSCSSLETFNASVYGDNLSVYPIIQSISVQNCEALNTFECTQTGISSLTLENLPSLTTLYCSTNKNLTGVVPAIFDQVYNSGGDILYDVRYQYNMNEVVDRGYGFYYEDEPERKYHRQ